MSESVDIAMLRRPQSIADVGKDFIALHHVFGTDISRRDNLSFIDDQTLAYVNGNCVIFENIWSRNRTYLLGIDDGGINNVYRKYVAVGCKGFQPNIYIYEYPSLKIHKILRGGAERGFSSLTFNHSGDRLASVAIAPDFMLTIWEWHEERTILHAKAFGQEIYRVRFSLDDDRRLTTSGTGHIRFWKMASTFTGQKLQGSIGKFGKVELSDIASFVEFPDGKVLSGTESGALLLWEGNFIKCRFTLDAKTLCHDAEVTYVTLDRETSCVITASLDGTIRWWSFAEMDVAEVDSDHSMDYHITPTYEYKLAYNNSTDIVNRIGIKCMLTSEVLNNNMMLVLQDTLGRILLLKFPYDINVIGIPSNTSVVQLYENHGSPITGLDVSPKSYLAVTSSLDGKIILWDYANKIQLFTKQLSVPVTAVTWIPNHIDPTAQSIMVGCGDGVVKGFVISNIGHDTPELVFTQTITMKPHNMDVTCIAFSNSGLILATAGKDGNVFFFDCNTGEAGKYEAIRFVPLCKNEYGNVSGVYATSLSWSGACLLCSCTDGIAREIDTKNLESHSSLDVVVTYESACPVHEFCMQVSQLASSSSAVQLEDGSNTTETADSNSSSMTTFVQAKVQQCVYSFSHDNKSHDHIFAAIYANTNYQLCEGMLSEKPPILDLAYGAYSIDGKDFIKAPPIKQMKYNNNKQVITVSLGDGSVAVRPTNYVTTFASVASHNGATGGTVASTTSFDNNFLLSVGADGLLIVSRIKITKIIEIGQNLGLDIQAGVYGDQKVKSISKQKPLPEPSYLYSLKDSDTLSDFIPLLNTSVHMIEISNVSEVSDIPSSAYSIQDSKLKLEEDNRKTSAEHQKDKIRHVVDKLRKEFSELCFENNQLPDAIRLNEEALLVDAEYFEHLKSQGQEVLKEIGMEYEYAEEKSMALVKKIKKQLMGSIIVEEMPLYGFRTHKPPKVYSFRASGLQESLRNALEEQHNIVRKEEEARSKSRVEQALKNAEQNAAAENGSGAVAVAGGNFDATAAIDTAGNKERTGTHGGGTHGRRLQRLKRLEHLRAHDAEKPKENEDDIRDINAIQNAIKTIGCYNLKSSDEYQVPEDQIINALKKHRQMVMLEETMIMLRMKFNERFLSMRNLKKKIVDLWLQDNIRINEIDKELNETCEHDVHPSVSHIEYPDDKDLATEKEVSSFRVIRKKIDWENAPVPPHSIFEGKHAINESNSLGYGVPISNDLNEQNQSKIVSNTNVNAKTMAAFNNCLLSFHNATRYPGSVDRLKTVEESCPVLRTIRSHLDSKHTSSAKTIAAISHQRKMEERVKRLSFERDFIIKKYQIHMSNFDQALDDLRLERHSLSSDLKLAELKLLTLYQEYNQLLTFQERDKALLQKQQRCLNDKSDIAVNSTEIQNKLDGKMEEMNHWTTKLATLTSELRSLVPESHMFADILTKIYKKKIKRNRTGDDGDGDEEEVEEEEDDDEDFEDDDVEDICPPGCDVALYDKVLEIREKRLDIEEVMTDIQKALDDLKKSKERMKQREKQIDKDSRQTESEIQQFQLQKQAALNKIEIYVPLCISQLHTFESSGVLSGPDSQHQSASATEEEKLEDIGMIAATTDKSKDSNSNLLQSSDSQTPEVMMLRDPYKRSMVENMDLMSHTLFKTSSLDRLRSRIDEIKSEFVDSRYNFKSLHKEKQILEKVREAEKSKIENWREKVNELQMLKFGRIIDLDSLDDSNEYPKEVETEKEITKVENDLTKGLAKLQAEEEEIRNKLSQITQINTSLLQEYGSMMNRKLEISKALNVPGDTFSNDTKLEEFRDAEDRRKLELFVSLQRREIDSIKDEISILRRKETAQFSNYLPPPPSTGVATQQGFLPPIPSTASKSPALGTSGRHLNQSGKF